ncbi:SPOR domain-containing protein [candidate division KSB1 bacterium]|nr:SPOR domain-containing protein [candidate division KSB1 bacterium]
MRKLCVITCVIVLLVGSVNAQDLEQKLLRLIDQNNLEQIYNNLTLIKQKFPDQPIPYYVEAFIERDADYASQLYRDFVERFPQSNYAASARYKLAQYNYARSEFQQAIDELDKLLTVHPASPLADAGAYLKIQSLLALDRKLDAINEYQKFVQIHPNSDFTTILKKDFGGSGSNQSDSGFSAAISSSANAFTIQVGAFSSEENARSLKDKITSRGYPAEISTKIVGQNLYYVVWVGNFESDEQAEAFGEIIKREFQILIRIVQK